MEYFQDFGQKLRYLLNIGIMDVIDILIVAAGIYTLINLLRRTRTNTVIKGVGFLLLLLWISDAIGLRTVNFILRNTAELGLLALLILFQPEIRRILEKLGTGRNILSSLNGSEPQPSEQAIQQILEACKAMSASKTGALMIFERENRLSEQITSGTVIDAEISAELLKNLFFVNSPLHDGAVIIRDWRICSAGCVLPLTNDKHVAKELGMRHRAGMGMSESSDALVVIISEETGAISVAVDGMLKRSLDMSTLEKMLRTELVHENEEGGKKVISKIVATVKGNSDDKQ